MSFEEAVMTAANNVLEWGLPAELLPLTITNEAIQLTGNGPHLNDQDRWS